MDPWISVTVLPLKTTSLSAFLLGDWEWDLMILISKVPALMGDRGFLMIFISFIVNGFAQDSGAVTVLYFGLKLDMVFSSDVTPSHSVPQESQIFLCAQLLTNGQSF